MIHAQDAKAVIAAGPDLLDNESATAVAIDTYGFDYLTLYSLIGATDIAMSALKLTECDTEGGSYTDVPGAGISPLPTATDDSKVFGWYVTLIGRKRFFKIVATAGDGTAGVNFAALALLTRARKGTSNAAERGLAGQAVVV